MLANNLLKMLFSYLVVATVNCSFCHKNYDNIKCIAMLLYI